MDFETALYILDLNEAGSLQTIKQQYHKLALIHHPDKNPSLDSNEKFKEINEAYKFLEEHFQSPEEIPAVEEGALPPYQQLLFIFLNNLYSQMPATKSPAQEIKFFELIEQIVWACEKNIITILQSNKNNQLLLKNVLEIITKYKDIFHISIQVLDKIQEYIRLNQHPPFSPSSPSSPPPPRVVYVNSKLKDLLEGNVYIYNSPSQQIYIPLWALNVDLAYDVSGEDVIFQCACSVLSPDVQLNEKTNDLFVSLYFRIGDVWGKEHIEFHLDGKPFTIETAELAFKPFQMVMLENCGIPIYNPMDVFDVTQKANIVVSLNLTV